MNEQHLYVRKASAGSGKTYTLAAHYIALLMQGENYRNILAVTFTNKATAEMKERILTYLHAIATETGPDETQDFLRRVREIAGELGYRAEKMTDSFCQAKAAALYKDILSNYDQMRVSTIDTFLQELLAGMVQKLGGAMGYNVELDSNAVIEKAVEKLLTEGAQDEEIRNSITQYMKGQLDDEKDWNIRKALIEIAKELYKELLQEKEEQLVTDEKSLKALQDQVAWQDVAAPEISSLKAELEKVSFAEEDFTRGDIVMNRLANYRAITQGENIPDKDKAFQPFTETIQKALRGETDWKKFYKGREDETSVRQRLQNIQGLVQACRKAYLHDTYVCKFLNDLRLMKYLKEQINEILYENNSRLLTETAHKLAQALKPGDADFILEKAGIRYRHIMLDEFQDTSSLQWENFKRLLAEILAGSGSTLIVGDVKQSIYRWRNGDWKIMDGLDKPSATDDGDEKVLKMHYNTETPQLVKNFRSEREVVKFNLQTFQYLARQESESDKRVETIYEEGFEAGNLHKYYRATEGDKPGHEGGFVQLRFFPQTTDNKKADTKKAVRKNILLNLFESMEALLAKGCKASDMLILIRNRREIKEVMNVLDEMQADGQHPHLAQTRLVSNDSFALEYSRSVNIVIQGMKWVYRQDKVARQYLLLARPDQSPDLLDQDEVRKMPLTDLAQTLCRKYLCDEECRFTGNDLAYLNSLNDQLKNYIGKNGSDAEGFLRYWDDRLHEKTIASTESGDIRIMTIHSSKGLEADNVFIPFCEWAMEEDKRDAKLWCEMTTTDGKTILLPIPKNKDTADAGFEDEYQQEHLLERIDNLNLLYVAFTRAAKRLYVYAPVACKKKPTKEDEERRTYTVGKLLAEEYGMLKALQEKCAKGEDIASPDAFEEQQFGKEWWDEPQEEKKQGISKPFSFKKAQEVEATFHSSDSHIVFRQSGDARKYGWNAAEDILPVVDRKAFGTICHEILAQMGTYTDMEHCETVLKAAVTDYYRRGIIPDQQTRKETENILLKTIRQESIRQWFVGQWELLREDAILYLGREHEIEERRMDRVMIDGEKAIVLDYKFGQEEKSYQKQVQEYMHILGQMGYKDVSGYLWIANEEKLIHVERKEPV